MSLREQYYNDIKKKVGSTNSIMDDEGTIFYSIKYLHNCYIKSWKLPNEEHDVICKFVKPYDKESTLKLTVKTFPSLPEAKEYLKVLQENTHIF